MKTRLVTAGFGLLLWAVVLFFYDTFVLNIVVAAIAAIGVHEMLLTKKFTKYKVLSAISILYSIAIQFLIPQGLTIASILATLMFTFGILCVGLKEHEVLYIHDIAYVFMMTILIAGSYTSVILIRNFVDNYSFLYCLIMLGAAWLNDAGAYFIGVFFGKHKLAPKISPKKTVEGAIGGILTGILGLIVGAMITKLIFGLFGIDIEFNYWIMAMIGLIGSIIGTLGDLFFSVIKRQNGIKDFGSIFPGHGGVLDRFDSVIFVAPCIAIIFYFHPVVSFK